MNKVLSIVVPSYNTEQYIDFCLPFFLNEEKVLDQIEILIINDGSEDRTLEKAIKYEKFYPNTVKVIDKENGGHGSTINVGIKKAIGKYVKVIDGDDWIKSNSLIKLIDILNEVDCDMIVNPYITYNEKNGKERVISNKFVDNYKIGQLYNFDDINFGDEWIQMHSITYKTKVLQEINLILDENTFYVDVEYILYPIPYIRTICFLDFPVYVYRINSNQQSVSIQGIQKNINHHKRVVDSCLDFFYSVENNISKEKRAYIEYRIVRLINTQYNIFFTFEPNDTRSEELSAFDLYIKKKHKQFYSSNKDNMFVKIYKKNNKNYKLIHYLNKLRLMFRFI